jgi:hypothetical protein
MIGDPQPPDLLASRLERLARRVEFLDIAPRSACRCPLEILVQRLSECVYSIATDPQGAAERFRDLAMTLEYAPTDPARLTLSPHEARVLMATLDALETRYGRGEE